MSVSGLSSAHVRQARNGVLQAAIVGLHHAPEIHYTEGGLRWEGMDRRRDAAKGEYPRYADCSAFATWTYYNGLYLRGHHSDILNHLAWRAGFTGTETNHGVGVSSLEPADLVFYGFPVSHVAIFTGGGLVVSHGSEAGPLLLPVHYRSDVHEYRRYI